MSDRLSLADVHIRDLLVEDLSDSSIKGNFNIVNNSNNYISNLWYTTELYIDLGEDSNLINSFSAPFSIMQNEVKNVSFTHNLPPQLPKGNYFIIVEISNGAEVSSGFALEILGELGAGSVPFLTYDMNSSYLYNNEEELSIRTVSTFHESEEPSLKVKFSNMGNSSVSGYADINVYKRSELLNPEPIATKQIPNISFSALQTKDVELTLPYLDKPESYVAIIRIKDNAGNVISSAIKVNYIIGGRYATIVDSSIKKDGDLYTLDYFIRGEADGSRLEDAILLVKIFNDNTNELISEEYLFFSTNFSTKKVPYSFSLNEDITNIKVITQIYHIYDYYDDDGYFGGDYYDDDYYDDFYYDNDYYDDDYYDDFYYDDDYYDDYYDEDYNDYLFDSFIPENLLYELVSIYDLKTNAEPRPRYGEIHFTDVEGTIYEEAIYELADLGIINGYPDGTFRPNNTINRAEIATLITYMLDRQDEVSEFSSTQVFNDVEKAHWANGFINIIKDSDLIVGYPDGTFRPNNNITFAETLTILVIAINGGNRLENTPEWPENYLQAAEKLMLTYDFDFESGSYANRGEIAILVYRALQYM